MSLKFRMHRNERRNFSVGFSKELGSGDVLTGPAVSVWDGTTLISGGNGFVITGLGVSNTIITDSRGHVHPVGQAVVFTLTGDDTLTAQEYQLRVEGTSTDTSELLVALDASGNPPVVAVSVFGEA